MKPWGFAALALLALVAGGWAFGWQGVVLVLSIIVLLLLMQFTKLMRVMQRAGRAPLGRVPSCVMLHSRLRAGQALVDVLALAGALGESVPDQPRCYRWQDAGGDTLSLQFDTASRLQHWTLQRAS